MDHGSGVPVGIELRTSDEHIARSFYGRLLGWDIEQPDDDRPPTVCRLDGDRVATVRVDGTAPGAWRIVLAGGDGVGLAERVEGAGGTVGRVTPHLVDVVDPLGAVCTVATATEGVPLDRGWARPSWFEIMTTDAATTDRFYRSVFHYGISGAPGASDVEPFAVLTVDGQPVAGRLVLPGELAALLGDRWMMYLAVRDVDAAVARADQLGAAVLAPPRETPTGRVSAVRDPCGAVFTLFTPAASE